MRLSKIRLAGFKSFVDPTAVHFPSNLTGVVGPNGCGKSNIIDAVRWVMGEISAKHLRGDSMADVIFNGSGGRKPVGSASVELVFDNADGAIGGAYASYAEVSLKRLVSRDGQSTYFINGSKCRRKDITQLFLGTGLGSRSYAIIEQGMISRLIEAKADDMRAFIEEAAGISRYKERRRETESRMAHTRENLERLSDVREEVDKQIRHLQRQAAVARRYQELKDQQRRLHAESLALRLRDLDADMAGKEALAMQRDIVLQSALAGQRAVEVTLERSRILAAERTEALTGVQARYYQAGADASRTEQSLQHARDMRQRQSAELERLAQGLAEATLLLQRDQLQVDDLTTSLAALDPELAQARDAEASAVAALEQADDGMQQWQQAWEAFNREANSASQRTLVERTRIDQLDTQMRRLVAQRDRLADERGQLTQASVEAQIADLTGREAEARDAGGKAQASLQDVLAELNLARDRDRQLAADLDRERDGLQRLRGQLVSQEALQQAALGQAKGRVVEWLASHRLERRPRLAQLLSVEPGWDRAVETVLGSYLEAVCVDGLDAVAELIEGLQVGQVVFVGPEGGSGVAHGAGAALLARVQGPPAVEALLGGIAAVETLGEALARRGSLASGQSIITRDGVWIGPNWLRVSRDKDTHAGVIEREKEIRGLREAMAGHEQRVAAMEAAVEAGRTRIRELDDSRDDLQVTVNRLHRDHVTLRGQLDSLRARAQQTAERLQRVTGEEQETAAELARDEEGIRAARQLLEAGLAEMHTLDDRRIELERQRDERRAILTAARTGAQAAVQQCQQFAIRAESQRSTLISVQTNLDRVNAQVQQYGTQRAALKAQLTEGEAPIAALQAELEQYLARRHEVERELGAARAALEAAESELREIDQQRSGREAEVVAAREALDAVRLGAQEARVRRESVLEQFAATRFELATVLEQVPPEATTAEWEQTLTEVSVRIEKLGAVNLASIDELKEQAERKEYLDRQFADLTEALNTLDQAIKKIDRETRSRFQDTFDRINSGLKEKFPRLFGGGSAYLELVGEDVLSAGVAVMARPPGKRNSTISQLSGGEKALTAVALVFSIFELNPAPFCLLDEVDAPLDEHNVGRFCEIVRDMSERVQFIFITHNKNTMELAKQLIGVTMNEPGVSRLVAVDVDEAVRLAAV